MTFSSKIEIQGFVTSVTIYFFNPDYYFSLCHISLYTLNFQSINLIDDQTHAEYTFINLKPKALTFYLHNSNEQPQPFLLCIFILVLVYCIIGVCGGDVWGV